MIDTGGWKEKKVNTPNGRPTYDLLVICLGALTLSNRRLRELRPLNYNPDQKVLGHLPFFTWFCMEFAANLRYTLINMALTGFFPHSPTPKQS